MLRTLVIAASAAVSAAQAQYSVSWSSPSAGPGRTQGGHPTYMDAMPLGNGALTALAWANISNGGVGLYVGHQMAQSSHTELFKLALLQVSISPAPGTGFFNQTLDPSTGTVTVFLGGTSTADADALLSVWADANSDALLIDISSPGGKAFSFTATVMSVRPTSTWHYRPPFGWCADIQSEPDVFVDPVPPAVRLRAPAPQTRPGARRAPSPRSAALLTWRRSWRRPPPNPPLPPWPPPHA